MRAVAVDASGTTEYHTLDDVRQRLTAGPFAWIDVACDGSDGADLAGRLGLELPRLAWLGTFDQPARIEVRDHMAELIVPFVTCSDLSDVHADVHAVANENPLFLLTVHAGPVPALEELRSTAGARMGTLGHIALYLFLDAATSSFKRALVAIGRDLEDLQDQVSASPDREQLLGLVALRRRLVELRRRIGPYADAVDMFVAELPSRDDLPEAGRRLVPTLHAHLTSLCGELLSFQDATAHEMETYATLVTMRQSQVINRLTIVSTVLLPITYLTSLFGMNFPFMVEAIAGPLPFLIFGVALQIGVVAAILLVIHRRGWLRMFQRTDD